MQQHLFSPRVGGGSGARQLPEDCSLPRPSCRAMVQLADSSAIYYLTLLIISLCALLFCSEFVESSYYRALLWDLLEFDSVDPWGVDEGGRVHVRLSAQLWSNVQRSLPECSVVIANVENYVTEAEKQMTSKAESVRSNTTLWLFMHNTSSCLVFAIPITQQ